MMKDEEKVGKCCLSIGELDDVLTSEILLHGVLVLLVPIILLEIFLPTKSKPLPYALQEDFGPCRKYHFIRSIIILEAF